MVVAVAAHPLARVASVRAALGAGVGGMRTHTLRSCAWPAPLVCNRNTRRRDEHTISPTYIFIAIGSRSSVSVSYAFVNAWNTSLAILGGVSLPTPRHSSPDARSTGSVCWTLASLLACGGAEHSCCFVKQRIHEPKESQTQMCRHMQCYLLVLNS